MPEKPDMAESDPKARDEVLKRMLKMKPTPHKPIKTVKKKKAAVSSAAAKR